MVYVIIVAMICAYGIASKKLLSHHSIHAIISLIVYSAKLASLANTIVKDAAYVENMMRLSVKKNLDLMELEPQENYDKVSEAIYWPRTSEI